MESYRFKSPHCVFSKFAKLTTSSVSKFTFLYYEDYGDELKGPRHDLR